MPYKTILVYFTGQARADNLLDMTAALARRQEAHVIGLYVVPSPRLMPAVGMHIPREVLDNNRAYYREEAAGIEARFERKMTNEGVRCEWRTVETSDPIASRAVSTHAQMCDLLIMSQPDYDLDSADEQSLPADILMECGRPVLFVPHFGKFDDAGASVFLAWNGVREAARAAYDALPLLQQAGAVRIHWINPSGENAGLSAVPGSELATSLARHGVKAEAGHSIAPDISIGDEILSRLADHGSDLLVMGGYGHSRFREMVFGGATRHILHHMTIPVLMSH